jgi:UDP-N-acetylglucosamine 2-epimerase (non-hydrolysing)/GDP/UDP-N,N'-diacetylbacillosamine 2-epimerase (hydrolysing)
VRTIAVVTVGRSDYGIYQPVLRRILSHADLRLHLIVGGMHLSPEFGLTACTIEKDGFQIADRVEMLLSSDTPLGIATSMGLGVQAFSAVYARSRPDLLVVLGDRFEMHAAALAALPFRIPIAHIHGGELSAGAIDDALRHSITKLSHLHFVSTEQYARRVIQLGEEPWRVTVSGAPALDHLRTIELWPREELETRLNLQLDRPLLLVTFHPVTLDADRTGWYVGELLAALEQCGLPIVFTQPNADTGGRTMSRVIEQFVDAHSRAKLVPNAGTVGYFSLMAFAAAMVGNSSSGIVEAASFRLPVVNVGTRQAGRLRAANVIDVGYDRDDIARGIARALDPAFKAALADLVNPYGNGTAAAAIVNRLRDVPLDGALTCKRFHDVPVTQAMFAGVKP